MKRIPITTATNIPYIHHISGWDERTSIPVSAMTAKMISIRRLSFSDESMLLKVAGSFLGSSPFNA
jgi:hypothetical protein